MTKICEFENCKKQAFYASYFDTPSRCKEHKLEKQQTRHRICICGKARPLFGLVDDTRPSCCAKCRNDEMVDIGSKKCKCGKFSPSYGLETEKTPTCCSSCRTSEMIDITHKRKCKCGKVEPIFGLKDDKIATCCSICRTDEMIDIVHKKCVCGKSQPMFGLKDDKIATCCKLCKTDEMDNIKDKKCLCGKTYPMYGLDKPICCIDCKTSEMDNVHTKKCKSNYLENGKNFQCVTLANKKYKDYCARCYAYHFPNDPLTFQIRCKTKEIAVRDYINSQFTGFHHDKPLWISECECIHKRRVDHRKLIGNTLLCIETDENQHKYYNKENEKARYNDLMMIHGGKFIFIRFNPDKYKENGKNKNPTIATRLIALEVEVKKQIMRIEKDENIEVLEEIYMFYDK